MRGRSSGKTGPPATRASPGKAGGLQLKKLRGQSTHYSFSPHFKRVKYDTSELLSSQPGLRHF